MNIQELGTIMEQQAPVKMILLNNNYLGNVRQWQDLMFEGRRSFTHMLNPRYEEIAKAYGIPYDDGCQRIEHRPLFSQDDGATNTEHRSETR